MPEQATVQESDVEDLVALLKGRASPAPFGVLLERYVARLKERVTAATEAADQSTPL